MAFTQIDLEKQTKDQSLVTSKIKDGAVVDSKISSSANISISKLNTTDADFDSSGVIKNGKINTNKLENGAVTYDKLAAQAVHTDNIQDAAVREYKIGNEAVTNSKIANYAVDGKKIASESITDEKVASTANISISKLNTTNADFDSSGLLKNSVVTSSKIVSGSISNTHIASDAAIAYSKLNIADGDLTIAKTNGLQSALDSKLALSGGTMSGDLNMALNPILNLPYPTNANDPATKSYVDSLVSGITWKKPVKDVVSTLPSSPSTGDRYLINSGQDINKIAEYNGSSWTYDIPSDNWAVLVSNGDYALTFDAESTDSFKWIQFTGAGQINAGVGLEKVGNTLNIKLGAGIKELPTDEVGLDLYANGGLELVGSPESDAQLKVKVDNTTIQIDGNGALKVVTAAVGDNLGNHTATQNLNMNGYAIDGATDINASSSYVLNNGTTNYKIAYDTENNLSFKKYMGSAYKNFAGVGTEIVSGTKFRALLGLGGEDTQNSSIISTLMLTSETDILYHSFEDGSNIDEFSIVNDFSTHKYTISSTKELNISSNNVLKLSATNGTQITGSLKIVDGKQASGKVLTSDESGNARWQPLPAGEKLTRERFTADGDSASFQLSGTPISNREILVYLNGLLVWEGSSDDYTYNSGNKTVTFNFTPASESKVQVVYTVSI